MRASNRQHQPAVLPRCCAVRRQARRKRADSVKLHTWWPAWPPACLPLGGELDSPKYVSINCRERAPPCCAQRSTTRRQLRRAHACRHKAGNRLLAPASTVRDLEKQTCLCGDLLTPQGKAQGRPPCHITGCESKQSLDRVLLPPTTTARKECSDQDSNAGRALQLIARCPTEPFCAGDIWCLTQLPLKRLTISRVCAPLYCYELAEHAQTTKQESIGAHGAHGTLRSQ